MREAQRQALLALVRWLAVQRVHLHPERVFVVSAMVTALMVFYQPYKMFLKNKRREAMELVVNTAFWLVGMVVFGLLLAVIR